MRTRGASSCVWKTPTAFPDWTSIVSLARSRLSVATIVSKHFPVARGPARSAVDDELLRLLGDVGVEVVLEHPEGGLLGPAEAAQLRAARGADGAGRPTERSCSCARLYRRDAARPLRRGGRARAPSPRSRGNAARFSRSGWSSRSWFQARIFAAEGAPDPLDRRRGRQRPEELHRLERRHQLDRQHPLEVLDDRGELAGGDRRHRDVVLLGRGGRDRVDRGRDARGPCTRTRGPPR